MSYAEKCTTYEPGAVPPGTPPTLTLEEVATVMGVSSDTVKNWVKHKCFPFYKNGAGKNCKIYVGSYGLAQWAATWACCPDWSALH